MADVAEILIGAVIETAVAVFIGGIIYRSLGNTLGLPSPNKVLPFQRGVLMKGEEVERILGPGRHWISPKRTFFLCDVRPKPFQLNSQDIQCADGRWVRVSMRGETRIVDAARYVTASSDSLTSLYVELRRLLSKAARLQSSHIRAGDAETLTATLRKLLDQEAVRFGIAIVTLDIWELFPLYSQSTDQDEFQELPVQ
jgi:regulator of protease activity HflC (stomatin/prohibitin superfamily)